MKSDLIVFFLTVNAWTEFYQKDVVGFTLVSTEKLLWTLTNSNGSIFVPNTLHHGVYTDLKDNGFLKHGDFYYRYNDLEYRWVSYENWTYTTYLELPDSIMSNERVALEFDGLDTVAKIYVNDILVHESQNMFTRNIIDVKQFINPPDPTKLSIIFLSPVKYSEEAFLEYNSTYGYEILPECVVDAYKGECHANTIRKMQASFSWDWGPAFPNFGIWKPWRVVGWSFLKINNVYFESVPITPLPEKQDPNLMVSWTVYYKIFFDLGTKAEIVNCTLRVSVENVLYVNSYVSLDTSLFENGNGFYKGYFIIQENTVETWWPNGYGKQPLYNFTASLTQVDYQETEVSSISVKVGFRNVKIDESFVNLSDPTMGRYFRAKVNNVYIYLMGSNWIPAHILPEQVTPEYTRQLLEDAKNTHQNCIRVWGGGIYETDEFYNIADEMGILIWQDMMFACSMYPANEDFMAVTASEIKTQVERLQHHPSILLWATNNENEAALSGNWYGTEENYDQYKKDYVRLYVNIIAGLLKEADASRSVVISSPGNGIASEEEGYIAQNPYDNRYGDVHYYNYFSNGWKWETYPPTRFASEYGFQSFPSYQTLSSVFDVEDMTIDSPMMEHRQHHPNGQSELKNQLKMHFDYSDDLTPFRDYLYLVQLHQAIAVKTETEFYRRMRDTLNPDGSGLTMGALYWQLNDVWQGASWSSIEYGGRWKILHYYAKKFFSPIIIVPWIENGKLKLSLVNDSPKDISEDEKFLLDLRFQKLDSPEPVPISINSLLNISIASQSSAIIYEMDMKNLENHCTPPGSSEDDQYGNCFVDVKLLHEDTQEFLAPANFLLLGEPKNAFLQEVSFEVDVQQYEDDVIQITLKSDRLALLVHLETPFLGTFSDNGFILSWNESAQIFFYGRQITHEDEFRDQLRINYVSNWNFVSP